MTAKSVLTCPQGLRRGARASTCYAIDDLAPVDWTYQGEEKSINYGTGLIEIVDKGDAAIAETTVVNMSIENAASPLSTISMMVY